MKMKSNRANETHEEREARLAIERSRASASRAAENLQQRLEIERSRASTSRAAENLQQREARLEIQRSRTSTSRASETAVQRETLPIILLRNIDPPWLCNGTRLAEKKLRNNLIEATIKTGKYKGTDVLLPRIPMIPTDLPFDFKRLQFPARLAFAMTVNKTQDQSLQVFGKPTDLYVYAPDGQTKNIVYPKALQ